MKTNKNQNVKNTITMEDQFIELLNIHGVSGDEANVRDYLVEALDGMVDKMWVDTYGNLLAEKVIGNGTGATIMLSAHMDTVRGVLADRKLIHEGDIITSSKGALGADDRGGIAIILEVLRNVDRICSYDGVVKLAFPREEEIGCVGSSKIDKEWYKDVDLAIVVDRRGDRDIVVGCGMAFCCDRVGYFMEDVAGLADMDWKAVEGGISDAMTFAEAGINSINLSAGYMNEHTEREYASISAMKETILYILQTFAVVNNFFETFEEVPFENEWVKSWYGSYGTYQNGNKYDNKYYSAAYGYGEKEAIDQDIFGYTHSSDGDVYVYEVGTQIVIQQGENEILLGREELRDLLKQLKGV